MQLRDRPQAIVVRKTLLARLTTTQLALIILMTIPRQQCPLETTLSSILKIVNMATRAQEIVTMNTFTISQLGTLLD